MKKSEILHHILQRPQKLQQILQKNPELYQTLIQAWQTENAAQPQQESPDSLPTPPSEALCRKDSPADASETLSHKELAPSPASLLLSRKEASLPNGLVGSPYQVSLHARIEDFRTIPECGLLLHQDAAGRGYIIGTPHRSGDVVIEYNVVHKNQKKAIRHKIFINQDPKSLWKDLPPDMSQPFAKENEACEKHETPFARLLAARVRGRSHAHVGGFCDDDFCLRFHEKSGAHILAVADGAGSASLARYGAQLAVQKASATALSLLEEKSHLRQLPPEEAQKQLEYIIQTAVYYAFRAHIQAVEEQVVKNITLRALSTTLLFAISLPMAEGKWLSSVYWVGDGALALWQPETQTLNLLGESDGGEYSGETRFLAAAEVSPEAFAQRTRTVFGAPSVLLLMSDGVSDPKFEVEVHLEQPQYWNALWQELAPLVDQENAENLLREWLYFWSSGNHDDRSIALLIPHSPAQ